MSFQRSNSFSRGVLSKAIFVSIAVSAVLIAADRLALFFGITGWQRMADDSLGGLIAGAIFFLYERHRQARINEHLRVIELMNHHLRNALQPLMFVQYEAEQKTQVRIIEDCVAHIDWALREVLPGRSEEQFRPRRQDRVLASRAQIEGRSDPRGRSILPPRSLFVQWLEGWKARNQGAHS
jgi:hypothetical protein